jgi:hypothetical protein
MPTSTAGRPKLIPLRDFFRNPERSRVSYGDYSALAGLAFEGIVGARGPWLHFLE